MADSPTLQSSVILHQKEGARTRTQALVGGDALWLNQIQIAELFETTPQKVGLHLKTIFAEGELDEASTCKEYLQVRQDGRHTVSQNVRRYGLPAILAVGYRVRGPRGTQFRRWALALLSEYLVKGFTMDDERLKNPPGPGQTDYFDELLERIGDICAGEHGAYLGAWEIPAPARLPHRTGDSVHLLDGAAQRPKP
jgi:hypothetical protein